MPQIFTASADTRLRAFALGIVVAVLVGMLFIGNAMTSSFVTRVGWVENQPVPFSHKHHVGELGIDCRYCHVNVETDAEASLPASHVCMTCHSQIFTNAAMLAPVRESLAQNKPLLWHRVARLPDYVYFNHSIHIARGVPCATCHGRIDEMALTTQARPFQMQWCLSCHRDPGPNLRPASEVTRMDWSEWDRHPERHAEFGAAAMKQYGIDPTKLIDCDVCHR
jgi:ferredoxin